MKILVKHCLRGEADVSRAIYSLIYTVILLGLKEISLDGMVQFVLSEWRVSRLLQMVRCAFFVS